MEKDSPAPDNSQKKPFDEVLKRMLDTPPTPKKQDQEKPAKAG